MGQMEFSLLSIKNMIFLVVRDRVICYNDHGFIPMVSVITRLAGRCHWDLFLLYFIDSIKGSPVTDKDLKTSQFRWAITVTFPWPGGDIDES